ncbi:uncharacterized protein LOC110448868 isoform X2 [Mizuhopecten yessoensis]|uniref:uncharacterized protein LOC110448868 isoform X2 n=1 Tax=Mizuhopecten yessoensis TaxID=6573 RepID=UPI000B45A636|nr:uncharacterized protein LOC110448868 isoform X2 [Mizuhopecten yessoensis]
MAVYHRYHNNSLLHNEDCSLGYYTNDIDTQREEQVKYYIYCPSPLHCCGSFGYRICCEPPSTGDAYPSINAIVFGSIAAAIMFVFFGVCVIVKWRQPPRSAAHPQAQALRAITGGFIPRTPFQGLTLTTNTDNTVETSSSYIQTVRTSTTNSQTADNNVTIPPPLYEDCIRNNVIMPTSVSKENSLFTNLTNTNLDHAVPPVSAQGQHINSSDNTIRL